MYKLRIELENILPQFIYDLNGTCKSMDQMLDDYEISFANIDEEIEFMRRIDDEIFLCDCCSWWCEISEMEDDQICTDCSE